MRRGTSFHTLHIQRLEKKIEHLKSISRRFSWVRMGVFISGGVTTAVVTFRIDAGLGWIPFATTVIAFSVVAFFHKTSETWIKKFGFLRDLKSDQLARVNLDWGKIPDSRISPDRPRHSLARDLDLTGPRSLHTLIDTAVSTGGSLRLEEWLTRTEPDLDRTIERQSVVRELVKLPRFRDRLRFLFFSIGKDKLEGDKLLDWITAGPPPQRIKTLTRCSSAFVVLNIGLFLLNITGVLPAYWVITLFAYTAFYFLNIRTIDGFLEVLTDLDEELGKFKKIVQYIEAAPYERNENLSRFCRLFQTPDHLPSKQLRKVKLAAAAVGLRMNPVLRVFLNLLLPWDFLFANLASAYRKQAAQAIPRWLEIWYKLEAMISLANFAALHPDYVFPKMAAGCKPVFKAAGLGHPLLPPESKICNDFSIRKTGDIAVITGSNMAGKSTFIKTIGINLCLANAGGPVNASEFESIPFRLHTCIHIQDSLTDGFSTFYAEVICLKVLLERLNSPGSPLLYLIDEIFRGTNNRERLIGSRSYLKSLVALNGVGLLATHDLELAALASESAKISNYHFRDHVQDGRLTFDYRIHSGPSRTTNALKIMRTEGLPVEDEE